MAPLLDTLINQTFFGLLGLPFKSLHRLGCLSTLAQPSTPSGSSSVFTPNATLVMGQFCRLPRLSFDFSPNVVET